MVSSRDFFAVRTEVLDAFEKGNASIIGRATEILIEEVRGWRAILQKKEIEPT